MPERLTLSGDALIPPHWLGNDLEARTATLPVFVLVSLEDRGQADYQVLGAIGRLGGEAELVIPALTRFLGRSNALARNRLRGGKYGLIGLFGGCL